MTPMMSPLSEEMAQNPKLVEKCLEFSQALASQGQTIRLSIKSGTFSFSLDTREATNKLVDRKKKLSPSQVRRNLRRKEEFMNKKSDQPKETPDDEILISESEAEKIVEKEIMKVKDHVCNVCQKTFESESGLKIHMGKTHKKEILRSSNSEVSPLQNSPVKETPREEKCECCGEVMTPDHQCEEEDFNCKGCEMEFNCEEDLTEHEMSVHPNMCHICYQIFQDKETRYIHFREKCGKPIKT